MHIGVPKEIKAHEYRVGLTPDSVRELMTRGHTVTVETGAGDGIGCDDEAYRNAGATIVDGAEAVFGGAEMIVKVKEPQATERKRLSAGQILFTYLHLAPDAEQTADLVASGASCVAYETITDAAGGLPLLAPMSEVAGRLAAQAAARGLERVVGGRGVLMGGVPGVSPARVVVIGGGVVGENAITMALGLGADVVVLDNNLTVLRRLAARFGPSLRTVYATTAATEAEVLAADAVIGAVLVAGAETPQLVSADQVAAMPRGAVLVDVAIDQGGCFETSRATTHAEPTYLVDGVVHYCVANMPGAVPRTSTYALNHATLPHVVALAEKGLAGALADDDHLANGLNVHAGRVTCAPVAARHGYEYITPDDALAG
ncbi:alanine dehydrogenase [Salinisphaera sp. Q1T1-3]|uniref:alanine dehydrogenase n=1 Tax=Salinisphaera sp. Q1T1-3 TaxID=2321229 RepID=UPI000E74AADE|nr:alanine dehydrogenase [Salinisphaera sp. Q1T1-3]RJS91970.1 alanine dehydrogenase [Salinisphaera sp. Q1T1-3]